ncbi:methyltransferase [Rhodoplanes elegans]|uniref:Methyltransferase n=1 Tax=Rhodoplanes elegans TaxID=29408 RepID=A0A327KSI9_9BRAD|nr:class I SAM-dependent methyltransferase [Rhodoplanes elegans]MBK5957179.1 methyltransferase [Rhodoplanes elegans]RAI40355.1 methyltransferase [Rhodoplanes elegans]
MSKATSTPVTNCQICGSGTLKSVLFVGFIPPVNTMPEVGSTPVEQPAYPLEMVRCDGCGLVQIGLEVAPEILFPESYPYLSGTTRILRTNFANLRDESQSLLGLKPDRLVIDIGSNDGTLLSNFFESGYPVLGIEPSRAADVANSKGVRTLKTYFSRHTAQKVAAEYGHAQLVTAANVFAHIGNVHAVVDGILDLLAPGGVFISENHYLLDLVETVQYDTIYHEHLRYYHLHSLIELFDRHGLEVFHTRRIPTHGGSIRVYAARKGERPIQPSVAETLAEEKAKGLADGSGLKAFRERVISSKIELYELLAPLKRDGARIFGIGAPSRASTLINFVGLDDGILDAVMEVSGSHKLDKYIPGTRIPVLDEKLLYSEQPEYALLLSWHIAEELAQNLRKNGYRGKFIAPLPTPRIID